jgi:hypothetical protein
LNDTISCGISAAGAQRQSSNSALWPARAEYRSRVVAGEAHREPLLPLAAISPLQGDAEQFVRQVIGEPTGRFSQRLHRADGGLFLEFA